MMGSLIGFRRGDGVKFLRPPFVDVKSNNVLCVTGGVMVDKKGETVSFLIPPFACFPTVSFGKLGLS